MVVVGVHGIGGQKLGADGLESEWGPAFVYGLEAAVGRRLEFPPSLRLAFYGDLFLPGPATVVKGWGDGGLPGDLGEDELADLAAVVGQIIPGWEQDTVKGPGGAGWLAAAAAALDRRFGVAAGVLMLGELRQVRRYLTDPGITAAAHAAVTAAVTGDTRVLIGHSLGSVVALQWARTNPQVPLDLLLTLGSPLGLNMVRSRLDPPAVGGDPGLGHVTRWVNVYDSGDVVACACPLANSWLGVRDEQVDNGRHHHRADRYLGKRQSGAAIAAALGIS